MPFQLRSHSLSPLFCKAQIGQGTHRCGGIQRAHLLVNLERPLNPFLLEYNVPKFGINFFWHILFVIIHFLCLFVCLCMQHCCVCLNSSLELTIIYFL